MLEALGRVSIPLLCQGYKDTLDCIVLDLDADCDVILGDPWLRRHRAVLDFARLSLTFQFRGRVVTLAPPAPPASTPSSSTPPPKLLSLSAVRRAARKQRPMFMVYLRRRSPGTAPSEGEEASRDVDAVEFLNPRVQDSDSDTESAPESPSSVPPAVRSPSPRRPDRPSSRVVRRHVR